MTYPAGGYGSYGPDPWPQTSWDARAAGNFIGGGAGGGLVVFAALCGATGGALAALVLGGLALVALGLFCVLLELGRPFRAINVFRNPRTSWMAREALTATLLFPAGLAAAWGIPGLPWIAALLALAFVYCQARIVQAAKGIPAWREPLAVPLLVATALVEGGGLFVAGIPWHGGGTPWLATGFGALVLARVILWLVYRRRLAPTLARGAAIALDRAGRVLQVAGTLAPLVLIAAIASGVVPDAAVPVLAVIAGLAAAAAGAYLKLTLITGAGYNQGFALAHLPVRGTQSQGTAPPLRALSRAPDA
jgi:phenylacetyl-CoA:acceptor oxidoreductase subunit 2